MSKTQRAWFNVNSYWMHRYNYMSQAVGHLPVQVNLANKWGSGDNI